jgi:hypothetical protein
VFEIKVNNANRDEKKNILSELIWIIICLKHVLKTWCFHISTSCVISTNKCYSVIQWEMDKIVFYRYTLVNLKHLKYRQIIIQINSDNIRRFDGISCKQVNVFLHIVYLCLKLRLIMQTAMRRKIYLQLVMKLKKNINILHVSINCYLVCLWSNVLHLR